MADNYLRILGPFHAASGYSHMTRAALRMALLAGYTVQAVESDLRVQFVQYTDGRMDRVDVQPEVKDPIPDCQWAELEEALAVEVPENAPTLLIQLPTSMNRRCQYVEGARIGWTMGESDRICEEWMRCCRALDTLWLPSRWCHAEFGTKLTPPADLRVMPIPVDDRIYCLDGPKLPVRDRPEFLFCSVFTTTERKQWRLLMMAFAEEFAREADHVGMVLKPTHPREVNELAQWCRQMGARIGVLAKFLSDYDIAALYRAADCYVCPSPEGLGLPFLEAALCGIPSVALDRGGAADVVTPETGYVLRTRMDRILGHLPSVYQTDHRFPVASLAEVRRGLRRAVNDRKRAERAERARQAAMEFTPEALAPRFREEIERAVKLAQKTKRAARVYVMPSHDATKPQYGLALGAWGDAMNSLGMAYQMRDPNRPLRMIQFGMDGSIADFLREQADIDAVIAVKPESREEFMRTWYLASCSRFLYRDRWLPEFAARVGVDPADIIPSQINQCEDQPVARWHDAALPQAFRVWAHVQQRIWGDYIMLHPISTQSAFREEHWPHWEDAIRWLLEETAHKYVLTGTADLDVPDHERLVNLICRTPSMMHVLACAEQAKGIITTCNAVGHWSVIQRLPAIVCSNSVFDWKQDYYHRFMLADNVTMLYRHDTLEWFEKTATDWLKERFPEYRAASNGSGKAAVNELLKDVTEART